MGFFISDHFIPNTDACQKRSNPAFGNPGNNGFPIGGTSIFMFQGLACALGREFPHATPWKTPMPKKGKTSEFSDIARAKMTGETVAVPVLEKIGSAITDKEKGLLP